MSQIIGHISQVIGPVVDVYFEGKASTPICFFQAFMMH